MKRYLLFLLCIYFSNTLLAQEWVIEQTNSKNGKSTRIKEGDKVLISFKQLNNEYESRPSTVFIQPLDTGYTRVVFKARITKINENTIELKDLTVKANRTILFDKIDGIRKLTTGKQLLRATSQIVGFVAYGLGFAYIHENFWSAISLWAGGSTLIALASTDFHTKFETQWKNKIVAK